MKHPTKESFLSDVKDHKPEILLDSGLHRHIKFKAPWGWFDLITYPGGLLYRGDMGDYCFERSPDMFQFFGGREDLTINPSYWAEKCVASGREGIRAFDLDSAKEQIRGAVAEVLDGSEHLDEVVGRVLESLRSLDSHTLERVMNSLREFDDETGSSLFEDFYLREEFTFHYIWACYAIAWGVAQYRALTDSPVTSLSSGV